MLSPGALYERVAEMSDNAHTPEGGRALLEFLVTEWPAMSSRASTPEDAEVCRLAMLAALDASDFAIANVWRARALARFATIGWTEGVGSILMGIAFQELDQVNDHYRDGQTLDAIRPSKAALAIMDELERFTHGRSSGFDLGPRSPTQAVVRRFYFEKRGLLLLLDGDYDAARNSYMKALEAAAGNVRGEIKVNLGLALVHYLAAGAQADTFASEATAKLGNTAQDAGHLDLASLAAANSKVMLIGGRGVQAYEIL